VALLIGDCFVPRNDACFLSPYPKSLHNPNKLYAMRWDFESVFVVNRYQVFLFPNIAGFGKAF